jgi:hypothetical protein
MSILIGGPGSSGTTMLRVYVDRNRDIFSGDELNFFNKKTLYDNWNKNKFKLLNNNRFFANSTNGWGPSPGSNLLSREYGWTKDEIVSLINDSRDIKEFTNNFFNKPLKKSDKKIWVEKTPSNAYCFKEFLDLDESYKVIHMTRHPFDVVLSYIKRGMSPYFAAGSWIYNNATALMSEDSDRYILVKYENLVSNQDKEFDKIYSFINAKNKNILEDSSINKVKNKTKLDAWEYSAEDHIHKDRINSFSRSDKALQQIIISALFSFQICDNYENGKFSSLNTIEKISEKLGYDITFNKEFKIKGSKIQMWNDKIKRTLKFYSTNIFNYPGCMRD